MLEELVLENYVLFERATLTFAPGLTVVSGETGAGKSLLAGAISLALGDRATSDAIRTGADSAVLSAVFTLPRKHPAISGGLLSEDEDGRYVFERVLRDGKSSRLSVNGRPVAATALREISDLLIDLAAQNEHTRLVESSYQRELLDRFGGLEKEASAYADVYRRASSLFERLRAGDAERERVRIKAELVRSHLQELSDAAYDPGKDTDLDDRIRLLSRASEILALCTHGEAALYEDEDAVQNRIGTLLEKTRPYRDGSPQLREACERLDEMLSALDEAVRSYRDAADSFHVTPEELDALVERSELLRKLARRLNCAVDELPEKEESLRAEAETLAAWETDTGAIRRQLDGLLEELAARGPVLREKRLKAGKKLAKAVDAELADLGMPQANFRVDAEPLWHIGDEPDALLTRATAGGTEDIVFRIAPNPGEAASSLAETASGGECSRTMLALKTALSEAHCPPVLFFDEIDAGIGGRLGDAIARKLKTLSASRQVIAITHLPQVAACADLHLAVGKSVQKGRTSTTVRTLTGDGRIEEIAAMIRGEERTDTTRAQAVEMMQQHGTLPDSLTRPGQSPARHRRP